MSLINVSLSVQNAQVSAASDRYTMIVGYGSQGPTDTLVAMSSIDELKSTFGLGSLVEEGAVQILAGKRVLCWNFGSSGTLSYGDAPTVTNAGTATFTYNTITKPVDRSFLTIQFTAAGTVGTAGIKYKMARTINPSDGDFGPELALGTATFIASPDGIKIDIGAGTVLVDTRVENCEGLSPAIDTTIIEDALRAYGNQNTYKCDFIYLTGGLTSSLLPTVTTELSALLLKGLKPIVVGAVPESTTGTATSAWLAASQAEVDGYIDDFICVSASEAPHASSVSSRRRLASVMTSVLDKCARLRKSADLRSVARPALIDVDTSTFQTDDTSGPTVQNLLDSSENTPFAWDESKSGALDASRLCALRSVPGFIGTFVASAPMLSQPGSAIKYISHARVVSFVYEELIRYLYTFLGRTYVTDSASRLVGFERDGIESAVNSHIRALLGIAKGGKPGTSREAVSFRFVLDPLDSIADEKIAGIAYLGLLNSISEFQVPIVVSR